MQPRSTVQNSPEGANPNRYGDTEDKYLKLIAPTMYRHRGALLGYGLKLWPGDLQDLKSQNPHLAGFGEL